MTDVQVTQPQQEETPEPVYIEKTIDIVKAGKPRKVRVREIPIDWEGKEEIVVIKKMSFGERAKFSDKFLKIEMEGDKPKTGIDMGLMQIESLLAGIHEAPFEITRDYIEYELDGQIGEQLHKEVEALNKLTGAQKKK